MHQNILIIPFSLAFLLLNNNLSLARDVTFPPVSGFRPHQMTIGTTEHDDGVDIITGSDFAGLTTFANLPYANCFTNQVMEAYDVAFLGAPFDTVSLLRFTYLLDRSLHHFIDISISVLRDLSSTQVAGSHWWCIQ